MVKIKFGPGGLGGVADAIFNLENFFGLGLRACEVEFVYGIYLKKRDAVLIGKRAKELKIELSIHAPYWINLSSCDEEKVEASKKRILQSCEVGHFLGCGRKVSIVFHAGYYGKEPRDFVLDKIMLRVSELKKEIKKRNLNVILCPEIIGKKNVFGSIEEISCLVDKTGCGFCIDFAHVLARYGSYKFDLLEKSFPQKNWHCHFSGIEYGEKGEKRHKKTGVEEWKKILKRLSCLDKNIVIINESPDNVVDSVLGLEILNKYK